MKEQFITGEVFQSRDFKDEAFIIGEYDECSFVQCDFSGIDLSKTVFTDCVFTGCNLSMTLFKGTSFSKVKFIQCKMIGIHFETSNPFMFTVAFEHCVMDLSSFHAMKVPGIQFLHCSMREVDFSKSHLVGSIFKASDLHLAIFRQTNLEKADFRGAMHFQIDPTDNKIKKAIFPRDGLEGLLAGFDIKIVD